MYHHLYVASAFGVAGFCFILLVGVTLFQQRILNQRLAMYQHQKKSINTEGTQESL